MPAQSGKERILYPRLNLKISFFQDVFTIIEELTGDCPEVGLPPKFFIEKRDYSFFRKLQAKYSLTKLFITNLNKVKELQEWNKINEIIIKYKEYWDKNRNKILEAEKQIRQEIKFKDFVKKLEKITKKKWLTQELDVFLTLGYKHSGTYDREINVIRIGIHEDRKKYLVYTLYHELIHFYIVNHMKLKLKENEEEILCRTIFKEIFNEDKIAQQHWKENLSIEEIEKINKKTNLF